MLFCPSLSTWGGVPYGELSSPGTDPMLGWEHLGKEGGTQRVPFLFLLFSYSHRPLVLGQTDCSGEAPGPGHVLGHRARGWRSALLSGSRETCLPL